MLNTTIVMGRLTKDPEFRTTNSGIPVCSFSIACERDRADQNDQKVVDYFDCVAWRKTGEFVSKYFRRGKPILISGRFQMRDWVDKEGKKRRNYELLCNNVEFCGGDRVNAQAAPANVGDVMQGAAPVMTDLDLGNDDLPWEDHDLK